MKEDIHKNIKYINNKLGDENWVPLQINSLIRIGDTSRFLLNAFVGLATWNGEKYLS